MLAMTGHAKKLSDLGIVIPNRLGINRVLQSLPPSYKNFVMNYNMQNMNKELPELFGMLKAAEIEIKKEHQVLMVNKTTSFKKQGKSKGKFKKGGKKAATPPMKPKNGPKPDAECYYCKEKGHWKRNCSKYLADLKSGLVKKKKEGVGAMGTAHQRLPKERQGKIVHDLQQQQRQHLKDQVEQETQKTSKGRRARKTRDHRQSLELNDEDMCGLPCFTRRVQKTRVPSGFKLPDNFKKFDGLQDPEDWLVDYLETVKLTGGTRATAKHPVHLSGAARSWIKKLTPGSIDSWESFEDVFVKNFRSTQKTCGVRGVESMSTKAR
ncbi:hypothetical protein QYE76_070852 [Lolium multiflorum]|uniref:CCHC-type domain-containing protein n=1 Tax=Lolium multiflorum TaxID=4521 RepID=A0AAD8SIY7_LOLMU|nr:hypothetical protein QYE76_070852 [Lolium multiflorum]